MSKRQSIKQGSFILTVLWLGGLRLNILSVLLFVLSPSIHFHLGDPLKLSNHIKNSSVSKLPLKTIKFRYSLVIRSIVTSSLDYPDSIPSQKKLPARREEIVFY